MVLLLLAMAWFVGACGADPTGTSSTAAPPLLEPQFGETTRPQPGTVTLSDEAKAFVPPATMPLYRIVATPVSEGAVRELADRLGFGPDRRYSFEQSGRPPTQAAWVADGEWSLSFFRGDLNCFHLMLPEGDREAMSAFDRGEEVRAVSEEQAVAIAHEYLAALGFREGLGRPQAFVRTSVDRHGAGRPDMMGVVITRGVRYPVEIGGLRLIGGGVTIDVAPGGRVIGFSHTVQRAEPDEVEVPILPVEKAADDVRAGQGLLPNEASMDNVSALTIVDVELAYYDPPEGLSETHYRPIYVFRVRMADGSQGNWIVSAYEGVRR